MNQNNFKKLNLYKAVQNNNLIKIPPINLQNINEIEYLFNSFTCLINSTTKSHSSHFAKKDISNV